LVQAHEDAMTQAADRIESGLKGYIESQRTARESLDVTMPGRRPRFRTSPPDHAAARTPRRHLRRAWLRGRGRSRDRNRLLQLHRAQHSGNPPGARVSRHFLHD
jgi:hypothetical protein